MSSRKEEKEARRAERIANEQEASAQAARKRLVLIVGSAVLAAAVVAVVIILAVGGSDDHTNIGNHEGDIEAVAIPPVEITDLDQAAKAAGCVLKSYPNYGRGHTADPVTYKTNPPTSGKHYPTPADDGAYTPDETPPPNELVHSLEHGRVVIWYSPTTTKKQLGQLKSVFDEDEAYHVILAENQTGMPYAVAATAWTELLGCKTISDKTFDALRAFREKYTDEGPEVVP